MPKDIKTEFRLITLKEVLLMTSLSRTTLFTLEKDGLFPKRVKLSPYGRSVRWKLSEIEEFINERCEAR
ncbi:helix-turn-helix transcriptional regulator [Pseudoalteromonas spongiae]|uniref:helix-turn-helix transcriptional regulator n=1 Tax=Pseudoalteromonas spongiae TaxID=298657 RepID=UPI00110A0A9B|nr:AlpA family phage regulatory protein [Pseudoalteromonas spongiae]TMO82446.1 transcriptional regulator [Pseudoalteromonas spongiae]